MSDPIGPEAPPTASSQSAGPDGSLSDELRVLPTAIAPATRAAYIRDWDAFVSWCQEHGADLNTLPADPVLVAAYIATLAGTIGISAMRGRLAAIAYHHRRRGLIWPGAHPAIRETLASIGRAHGKPVRPSAALTSVEVQRLVAACAQDLAGLPATGPCFSSASPAPSAARIWWPSTCTISASRRTAC